MKITVIGVGNAFAKKLFNQCLMLEEDGRRLLFDCGQNINYALDYHKINPRTIDDVFISHAHSDHVGNLENFAFTRYDWGTKPTHWKDSKVKVPRLIANEGLLESLWERSLWGGMKDSMEGFQATLETFFETVPIKANEDFMWQGWTFQLIQQIHVMAGNVIMPTYGLLISKAGHKTIYLTADTQHCSPRQMEIFYKKADIIVQDCELTGLNMQFEEGQEVYTDIKMNTGKQYFVWPTNETDPDGMKRLEQQAIGNSPIKWERYKFGSGVHASYAQLAGYPSANSIKLPPEIKAKMFLSHYPDFYLNSKDFFGNDCNWNEKAKEDGFAGFLQLGQVIEV